MKSLNKKQIEKLIKISPPFLMVDKIKDISHLKSATGIKKIKKKEWFLKCHFTDDPVMPGTLLEEAMLQTIVSTLYSSNKFKKKICLIASAKTNFFSKIDTPTILNIHVKILNIRKLKVETTAIVKDIKSKKIASGEYNYFISKK